MCFSAYLTYADGSFQDFVGRQAGLPILPVPTYPGLFILPRLCCTEGVIRGSWQWELKWDMCYGGIVAMGK